MTPYMLNFLFKQKLQRHLCSLATSGLKPLIGCKGNKNNAENVLFIEPLQFIFQSPYAQVVGQGRFVYSADSMLFRRTRQSSNIEFSSFTVLALSIAMRVCLKSGMPLNIGLDAR